MASADERLIALINRGYQVLYTIENDYSAKKKAKSYKEDDDNPQYIEQLNQWGDEVVAELCRIFPTELETNEFLNPETPLGVVIGDYKYQCLIGRFKHLIRGLAKIKQEFRSQYTDLPIQKRLYVEYIDSFQQVRDVNPSEVSRFLNDGFLNWTENQVQLALEQILDVPFHKEDWAGEVNDLYTANVVVNGTRRATGFLLKGPGIGHKKEMTIADCGKNGDQILRLFTSPADLFVVQYVGRIAESVIQDVQGKVTELQGQGKTAHFLIIDGQDTARLLYAYGKLC